MKVQIADLMRTELIAPALSVVNKDELFRKMTDLLVQANVLDEAQQEILVDAISQREDFQCTSLGGGFALPHAYSPDLPENLLLLARVPDGVEFGVTGCRDVRLIFLLIGPQRDNTEHLMIIARIARLLKDEVFIRALNEGSDARTLMTAIKDVEARHY